MATCLRFLLPWGRCAPLGNGVSEIGRHGNLGQPRQSIQRSNMRPSERSGLTQAKGSKEHIGFG